MDTHRALADIAEVCLSEICSVLAQQASELEATAHNDLEQLGRSVEVNSEDLQLIRTRKNEHQRLRTRAEVVRTELHELLNDDRDLQRMSSL